VVPVVCAAAFTLALVGAWLRPIWHDELYTLALARLPITELLSALVVDSGPPLHYLLCHVLFVLVGWQEGSLLGTVIARLPSVLAFALLPWVVWKARPIGQRVLPWGPLLVIAWLPLVYFGTEARAYALLALVNALVWIRGPEWIERGGRRTAAFAATAACLPLLHYAGAASFLALPALALFVSRRRRRALLMSLVGAALPMLAWSPVFLRAPRASMSWVETAAGPGRPGVATVSVLSPAGPFPALFEAPSMPVAPWVSVSILGVLVCGVVFGALALRRRPDENTTDASVATRLAIGLLPAVAMCLLALGGTPVYFAGRTESMVWALAAALVAILALGLPAIARRIAVGSYLLAGVVTVAMWFSALPARPPAPGVEVGHNLAPMIEGGDRVVVAGLWQLGVRHGLAKGLRDGSAVFSEIVDVETVPRSQAEHPGWLDRDAVTSPELFREARALRESAESEQSRLWLVWSPALPLEDHFFPAFAGWQRGRIAASPVIAVDLLVPPPPDAPIFVDGGVVR
jgi:hypothetical protein